jgi:outer membrane protein OmpA-like peptidoglycan-associated protein
MNQSRRDFFWPSYVDLMTALFLIMLVLFVLSYKLFHDKQTDLESANAQLKVQLREKRKIDEIKEALKRLDNSRYFTYNQTFKRYELNFDVLFQPGRYDLPPAAQQPLVQAGRFLLSQMQSLRNDGIQYLVIIEGRAAMNPNFALTAPQNADLQAVRELSYNRALAVVYLWQQAGLQFPKNIEVLPAGSGYRGAGRYGGYQQEQLNKRFIIQIQPKIGSLDSAPAPRAR